MQCRRSSLAARGIDGLRIILSVVVLELSWIDLEYIRYVMRGTPTRCRSALDRSSCVTLKFLYKICVYAGVLKISIKFLSYALSLLAPSIRVIPRPIREDGVDDPSFRTNRRVSIVERSTRHASSDDACDVNEGRFYYFVPFIRRESALTYIYNRRFNFIKIFFLLINMLCVWPIAL